MIDSAGPSGSVTTAPAVVGVVGAGTMGAGIAQVALEHGHEVVLHDVDEAAIHRGRERIRDGLLRRARKRGLADDSAAADADARLAGLRDGPTLDALGAEADVVIEAAVEDLDLKRTIFRTLDAAARPEALLATNTSALSVAAIADATSAPERVVGLHFFNPAPVMALVEVVATPMGAPAAVEAASALVAGWGKTPVRCGDVPGFIVNRVNRPFTLEALRLLAEESASIEAIDGAIRAEGFPMGPFELMDLVGIDVNTAVAVSLYEAFNAASRFQPSPIQARLVAEGRLGRKTGTGFYAYDEAGGRLGPAEGFATPTGSTGSSADVADRIVLAIVNEAYHALDDRVAEPADIDLAMRLGAAHPMGPFERVERDGGPEAVLLRLEHLAFAEGDRFRPAPALLRAAGRVVLR